MKHIAVQWFKKVVSKRFFSNGTCSADLIRSATKSYLCLAKEPPKKEILFNAEIACTTVECVLYAGESISLTLDFELIFACTRIFTAFRSSQKQFCVM